MHAFAFICGFFYILSSLVIFASLAKRSRFWILFLSVEYFYILGLGVFPIAAAFGYAKIPIHMTNYSDINSFSPLTFFHIIFYTIGSLVGYFGFSKNRLLLANWLIQLAKTINLNSRLYYNIFLLISYVSALMFIFFLGFERVFYGASLNRSGVTDEFAGFESYLFLTRFLYYGVFAVSFMPFLLKDSSRPLLSMIPLVVLGMLGYFILSARYFAFQCILVPFLMYISYKKNFNLLSVISIIFLTIFSLFFVLYGKELPGVVASYVFLGGDFEFSASGSEVNFLDAFSHLVFSIDAGVVNFLDQGILISRDIFLSILGVVPSRIFVDLGLPNLSYQLLEFGERFACVNTYVITGDYQTCFLPPYFTGASAYFFPLAGAIFFGCIRFFAYAVLSTAWRMLDGHEKYLGFIILVAISLEQVMLFIPNSSSFVVFFWISLFGLKFLLKSRNR